jgi:hypothetical protein
MFLPFMSQVLGITFGSWAGDVQLALQALKALFVSCIVSMAAGATIAFAHQGPMQYHGFIEPLPSFAISAVIGYCAGVITEDDAGRRYLIGVAAAVQYGIYPVWIGYSLVAGFPDISQTVIRISTFGINVGSIAVFALIGYLTLDIKRKDVKGFVRQRSNK